MFVCQLSKNEMFDLYKSIKGYCLWHGQNIMKTMQSAMNEKVRDVHNILFWDAINYMEVYRDYTYGRY